MKQAHHQFRLRTRGQGLYEFTSEVRRWVSESGIVTGVLTLFVQHTSASLVVQENADPDVRADLQNFFARLAPEDDSLYAHTIEGPDDMPAHIRSALTAVQLSIPVWDREPRLGAWQGIYLFEHRSAPHERSVAAHLIGE